MTIEQSGRSDKYIVKYTVVSDSQQLAEWDRQEAHITKVTALRRQLRRNGFQALPVTSIFTGPKLHWSSKLDATDEDIRDWKWEFPGDTGTAFAAKFTPAINIDVTIGPAAKAVEDLARKFFGQHGNICLRFGFPPRHDATDRDLAHRRLIPLRTDEPFTTLSRTFIAPDDSVQTLEILGDGDQYVVDGAVDGFVSGEPYRWSCVDLETIKREELPNVRRDDMEKFLGAATKLLVEQFGWTQKTTTIELEWLRRRVAKITAEVEARKAANPEPPPKTLQQIREVIVQLKELNPGNNLAVDNIIAILDRRYFHLIRDWRGPFVDGARPRLRQEIGKICAELGIGKRAKKSFVSSRARSHA
jgi:hypothetical protein